MNKKILILTAGNTGGHRSASNSIKEAILKIDPSVNVLDYDSNKLFLGYKENTSAQGYITMTTRLRFFWKSFFEITSFFKRISNFCLYIAIKKNFLKLLKSEKPDLIISLHPCFVGSVIKGLKKYKNIPFYVVVLDPFKQSRLWFDKNATLNFLPVTETINLFLNKRFKKETLIKSGFPLTINNIERKNNNIKKLLFVNPSQKSLKFTKRLIDAALNFNVDINIVTGSDTNLKKYLEKKYSGVKNIQIFDYVNNMKELMSENDILLTKAGPNIMFEAIEARIPIIITGHLPGQEEKNPNYIVKNGYGFLAEEPKKLYSLLKMLLIEKPNLLNEISIKESLCPDLNGAYNIAKIVVKNLYK